jgi:hypothetical protein
MLINFFGKSKRGHLENLGLKERVMLAVLGLFNCPFNYA